METRTLILRPWPGKILLREDSFKYTGRIVIPDKAERRPTTGVVTAVGEGVGKYETEEVEDPNGGTSRIETKFTPYCHVGDRLIYGLYAGTVINIKGQPVYRVLNTDEPLLTVENMDDKFELEGVGT